MLSDLQDCRCKALGLKSGQNPPLDNNGKKKKYVDILQELWHENGYEHLGLSKDNLRVRANQLKVQNLTTKKAIEEEVIIQQNEERQNTENIANAQEDGQEEPESLETNEVEYTSAERETAKNIEDKAANIVQNISEHVGNFTNRIWETRTKSTPSPRKLQMLNKVAKNPWRDKDNGNSQPFVVL